MRGLAAVVGLLVAVALTDPQLDQVTAGDFTAFASAMAFGVNTSTSTLAEVIPLNTCPTGCTLSMSASSSSSSSP
jgi:hypothetical protein